MNIPVDVENIVRELVIYEDQSSEPEDCREYLYDYAECYEELPKAEDTPSDSTVITIDL